MWFKSLIIIVALCALGGCSQLGMAPGASARMKEMAKQQALLRTLVPIAPEDILQTKAGAEITKHPYTRLRAEPACEHLASRPFGSTYGYRETLAALQNRTASRGGNAMAITNWVDVPGRTYAVGHFFACSSKKYLY